ncbi:MAG TPA: NAD-glutamate dehydrogenase domain-containing protein, partial [Burkholderiaceae bacterium]
ARFDPALADGRQARVEAADARLQSALAGIADADGFELVTRLRQLAWGIVRTDWFRTDPAAPLPASIAFKVDGAKLPFLPAPRPWREIFVFSERFEGVHLRGGPVSRGGLRWSDRREDYRTEVLGLVKAQLVKNAVIVPTGAKGGFVCKLAGDDGRAVYRLFIEGLLSLTDDQTPEGRVVPPAGVVCHDDADPYLVVAADKGTAAFSDLANEIACARGFWLGDAFASGGSVGYDHKKLGITAKGAWETARIRFAEAGLDAGAFTAVGIGDMSGDVFGNGTLLMPGMRLLAAFDHRHVFIDPAPDVERAFAERRRLFALERSSWNDYDRAAISAGGGVWSRAERRIALSPQARAALGTELVEATPEQLIQAILRAPVDVLYNGGIGTYVKASHESQEDARDRANDRTRVDAPQVRARIVVEGGNLGLTQAGRVELAARGVLVYTDAVDNSGGVDCSDHEVNIKIALGLDEAVQRRRAALLAELGEEVERMVLSTNRGQARRLARHARHPASLAEAGALMDALAARTGLDRALEGLPDDATLAARPGHALLAPELAVVMAHAKMALKAAWLAEPPLSLSPWHDALLQEYFPPRLRGLPLLRHPLATQIIATRLANQFVDRLGLGAAERAAAEHDCSLAAVMEAFAFGFTALRLDDRTLADEAVAALPGPQRHACEAGLEQALGAMLSTVLARPAMQQPALWRELRGLRA